MFTLKATPLNPAQYFGACGFLELAGFLKPDIQGHWDKDGLCLSADEKLFTDVVCLAQRLQVIEETEATDEVEEEEGGNDDEISTEKPAKDAPFLIRDDNSGFVLRMDWWESRAGRSPSVWKCFSGQMSAAGTFRNLLLASSSFADISPGNLFELSTPLSGRLNYDPRSAWDAGDAGFSPNEHSQLCSAATFPFPELLSAIAMQSFPFNEKKGRNVRYTVWSQQLPLPLARITAAGKHTINGNSLFEFDIIMRSKGLNCFAYSRESHKITRRKP